MIVEIEAKIILEYLGYVSNNLEKLKPEETIQNIDKTVVYVLVDANLSAVVKHIERLAKEKEEESEEDIFRESADFENEVKSKFIKENL